MTPAPETMSLSRPVIEDRFEITCILALLNLEKSEGDHHSSMRRQRPPSPVVLVKLCVAGLHLRGKFPIALEYHEVSVPHEETNGLHEVCVSLRLLTHAPLPGAPPTCAPC